MRLELEPRVTTFPHTSAKDANDDRNGASWDLESLLKKGVAAAQSGDRDLARKLLSQASAIDPSSEDAWMWLASISDYPEELLAFLNRVLDINPDNERAVEWRAQTNSLMAKTFVQRALAARNDGSLEMASQFLDQALRHDEACSPAWFWKASLSQDDDEKIAYFEKALAFDPENTDAADAIARIERSRVDAGLDEARTFIASGDFAAAAERLSAYTDHIEDDVRATAWSLMAETAENDDQRLEFYQRVLGVDPENAAALAGVEAINESRTSAAFDAAKSAAAEGDGDTALKLLGEVIDRNPDSVEAWLLVSHLSTALDEKVNALEKVLDIDPENAAARSGLAFLALTFGSNKKEEAKAPEAVEPVESVEEIVEEVAYTAPEEILTEEPQAHQTEEHSTESLEFAYRRTKDAVEVEDDPTVVEQSFETTRLDADSMAAATQPEQVEEDVAAFYDPAPDTEEPAAADGPRSAEQIFGPITPEVSPDNVTVESVNAFETKAVSDPFEPEVTEDETVFSVSEPVASDPVPSPPHGAAAVCPFCSNENDAQALDCKACNATLTFSDLEKMLAGNGADRGVVQLAVTSMEAEWNTRDFSSDEFVSLAVGHFNLGNSEAGLRYLQEASRLNPNDVILSSRVNAIAIRLDEKRRQSEVHDAMPKGKTILVVDDSPTVRKLISGKLEKSGHNVVCAVDGVDALTKLEEQMPDLVLLDITMPRMDGYEVCKQIRQMPEGKDLPVVMISGKDGFFDKVRGRMAGTSGYVTKPFGPETLMKALETYLLPE